MKNSLMAAVLVVSMAFSSFLFAQVQVELTSVIKDIPGKIGEGKEVTVVGYYRGWDLLRETRQSPPVTRSDWVVADKSGAIYVQAKKVEIKGQEKLAGKELLPSDKEATQHIVRVTGIIRLTAAKQAYIEPSVMEILK